MFLQISVQQGYNIILSLDRNENMRGGKLSQGFSNLRLVEISQLFSKLPAPATFFKESK
jgi:hypothetical protein